MWTVGFATIRTPEGQEKRIRQAERHKCKMRVRTEITDVAQRMGAILKVTVRNYSNKPDWL